MRIDIKNVKTQDKDIRALYLIGYALESLSWRMMRATLEFFADKYGFRLIPK